VKDVFDHTKSDAAWAKLDSLDPLDPEYMTAVKEYLDASKEEDKKALKKLRELEAAEEEDRNSPDDPCDSGFMEDIST